MMPPVLDACCGSRMFWFDKADVRTLFVDIRRETHEMPPRETYPNGCKIVVNPDVLADFRSLPFPDDTFAHVVFDPPHFVRSGEKSGWLRNCYGWLDQEWKETLRRGFVECFRVLRPDGSLIFKWTATDNPVSEILKLTPMKPLYGHKSGKQAQTHWVAFLKPNTKHSEGAVKIKTDSGCYEVLMAIQSDHAAKAPTCADHSKIRVPLNAVLCDPAHEDAGKPETL